MIFHTFFNGIPIPKKSKNLPKNFGYIIQIKMKGVVKIVKEIWKTIK